MNKKLLALFGVIAVGAVAAQLSPKEERRVAVAETPKAEPSLTPEQKEAMEVLKRRQAKFGKRPEISAWDGSYRAVKEYLKAGANDPDSIKFEGCGETMIDESKGWLVGCSYYGKNKFGGQVKNFNWFIIKNETVMQFLSEESYKR